MPSPKRPQNLGPDPKLPHGEADADSRWTPQQQHGPSSSMAAAAAGSGQHAAIMQQPSSKESFQEHANGLVLSSSAAAVGQVGIWVGAITTWAS